MKDLIKQLIIHGSIISGILLEWFYGFEWAGNIALFMLWVMSIAMFIVVSVTEGELAKVWGDSKETSLISKVLLAANILTQIAAGWFFIGIVSSLMWATMWNKKQLVAKFKSNQGDESS